MILNNAVSIISKMFHNNKISDCFLHDIFKQVCECLIKPIFYSKIPYQLDEFLSFLDGRRSRKLQLQSSYTFYRTTTDLILTALDDLARLVLDTEDLLAVECDDQHRSLLHHLTHGKVQPVNVKYLDHWQCMQRSIMDVITST